MTPKKVRGPRIAVRDPQPMDAGFEHTMLDVGVRGKFVVAVGDRWTAYCFASRDAVVAPASSRSAGLATTGKPTAVNRVEFRLVPRRPEPHARRISAHSKVAEFEALGVVYSDNAQHRSSS